MVFAATAAGILALRTVVSNVADLTRTRKEALQNDSAWTQPDTAIDKPAQDVPKPTTTPAATEKPSATPAPAASQAPKATAAPPAQTVTKPGIWDAKPLTAFSGNELVYSATLGDWRTHNGADYAAPGGGSVTAARAGKVVSVSEDALWGGVVEVEDANGVTWRYCGVAAPAVKAGDSVTAAAALGTSGSIPAGRLSVRPSLHSSHKKRAPRPKHPGTLPKTKQHHLPLRSFLSSLSNRSARAFSLNVFTLSSLRPCSIP